MDVYGRGSASLGQRDASDWESPFAMPGTVENEILTVAHMVQLVTEEIAKQKEKVPPELRNEWVHFAKEWQAFATDKNRWSERVWKANYLKAVEYRERIEEFRGRLARAIDRMPVPWPAGPRGATPMPGSVRREQPKKKGGINWKWVLYGGLAIGGAYAVSELLNSGTTMRREFRNGNYANGLSESEKALRKYGLVML